jgi:hypothetical protein
MTLVRRELPPSRGASRPARKTGRRIGVAGATAVASALPPSRVGHGKRPPVAVAAIARELVGFLWAAMTRRETRAQVA